MRDFFLKIITEATATLLAGLFVWIVKEVFGEWFLKKTKKILSA
jgi:hypothetical protein